MSDQEIFAELFGQLLSGKIIDAGFLWKLSKNYDFHPGNVVYEEEAKKLGILDKWNEVCK